MADLLHKDFKITVSKMFRELKREKRKVRRTTYEQNEIINKELEDIKVYLDRLAQVVGGGGLAFLGLTGQTKNSS